MVLTEIGQNIAENLFIYVILLFILIISFFVYRILRVKYQIKTMETMAQIEMDRKKQELMEKKMVVEELRNSAIILNDRERKKLEEIKTDNSILSRKLLYNMNETEERMKRLELGNDNYQVISTLEKIKDQERRLFGNRKM